MEVGHDEKTDNGSNNANEFDFFIGGDATSKTVGNFLVKDRDGGTGGKNKHACKEPSDAKIPVHKSIIHLIFLIE